MSHPKPLETLSLTPIKVVAEPWRGRHRFYGFFIVPPGYIPGKLVVFKLRRVGQYCPETVIQDGEGPAIALAPEQVLVKVYLRTRFGLYFWLRGWGDLLQQAPHWTLICTPRGDRCAPP